MVARNYIGIAVLLYYTLSSTRSAGLFATNKAKPSIAQRSTVRRKYWQMHADILPDFDLAIQPRFTAENVNQILTAIPIEFLVQGEWFLSGKSNLILTERKHAINFNLKVDSDQGRLEI